MAELVSVTYEQARAEHFEALMKKMQRKIDYWQYRGKYSLKPMGELSRANIECSEAGMQYNFYKDALEALAAQPKWISVEERLPENEITVLAATKHSFITHNGICEIITISAVFHTDGKTFSGDSKYNFDEGDVDLIYDEDNDEYIVPEGWWESTYFTEEFAAVDEEVLYWMPLPELPKEG